MDHLLRKWHAAMVLLACVSVNRGAFSPPWSSRENELLNSLVSCEGRGSCGSDRGTEDVEKVSCQCGPICAKLGTCCFDSPYRVYQGDAVECFTPQDPSRSKSVFMIRNCDSNWPEDSVRELCEGYTKDLFLKVPVTHPRTGITYRNFYCYVCNFEAVDPPYAWDVRLQSEHPDVPTSHLAHPIFNDTIGSWTSGGRVVHITVEVPGGIQKQIQHCRGTGAINTCHPTWRDAATQHECHSYTALVSGSQGSQGSLLYRNPHCAICNFEDVSELICWEIPPYTPYIFPLAGAFTIQDKVQQCPRGRKFDIPSNMCRIFRCGRSRSLVDGECV